MFRADADSLGPYTIHREECVRVERNLLWWHGPFDSMLEACLPAVKAGSQINLCKICRPMPTPQEENYLDLLNTAFRQALRRSYENYPG